MTLTVAAAPRRTDQREAWYQARKKFSDIQLELPEGVVGPIFNDEYGDVYSLMYAVKGDGIAMAELGDIAEDVKRRLAQGADGQEGRYLGKQAERIYVEFSHERSPRSASRRRRFARA